MILQKSLISCCFVNCVARRALSMLFDLPAGQKTAQHVKLYLILFAWLIVPLLLQRFRRYLLRSLLWLHGCDFLSYSFIHVRLASARSWVRIPPEAFFSLKITVLGELHCVVLLRLSVVLCCLAFFPSIS